jgi:superfamily II DNA helicase RecQ
MLKKEDIDRQILQNCRQVRCQRFFVQKEHSQYFEVRSSEEQREGSVRQSKDEDIWSQAWEQASQHYDRIRSDDTIRPGETDEVNPWLRRTGWIPYLEGCDRKDILRCLREPTVDEEMAEGENEANDNERAAAAIWEATGELASASQDAVSRSGVMLRFEAIRTEAHQNVYRPLEPYQNRDEIRRQGRCWQQIVTFFVRTRRDHSWKSPSYKFNRRQDRAFERMMVVARSTVKEADEPSDTNSDSADTDSEAEGEGGKAAMTEMQQACLSFCIELLNQTIHNREYDMALVCGLAALGVNPSGQGFRGADTYPSILSAVIKVAHFMIVQQAERLTQPTAGECNEFSAGRSPCEFEDSGYESQGTQADRGEGRQKICKSSFEWVRKMMDGFMVRGCGSPMQWMLDLRGYGMKIDFNTTSAGHVNWRDGDTLEYKAVKFNMAEFRGMVGGLHQATRRALLEDLMFTTDRGGIPVVPWQHLYDDPSNDEAGWSFIRDQRSRLPVDGQSWLHERIGSRPDLRQRFIRAGTASGIDRERMRDWLRQVAAFRGKLLVLMHMTGGQPARGPEILSVRHRNTVQGGHRNLFIEDGMVVFVTRYHKGYEVKGDVKIIHRYLPREVGELVVWYLWLVLPFVQRMQALVWQQETISDHLWPADADGRKWTTERMKHELQRVSEAGLGQSINVAGYRQIAIAISRRWIRKGVESATDEHHDDGDWLQDDPSGEIADEQATHSPHVAGAVYARDTQELAGATASRRQQFRAISVDWHRFLGFQSTEQAKKEGLKRKRCPFEDEAEEARTERQVALRRMDAVAELQWMMGKKVTMRSVQGDAMHAIQQGESPIVVVMPTGSGKSVLFMLPAFVQVGGVTIVVVPLKALRADMVVRCREVNIRCAVWEHGHAVDGASIVLVTPEKAVSPAFGTFVSRVRQTQRLDRVVIDECHVILNDRWDFRQELQQLGKLAFAETQMLLLTATLPPTEEQTLFDRMYWRRAEVRLIRASTVRKNIEYSVVDGPAEMSKRIECLAELVGSMLRDEVQPDGKVVVMCESKPEISAIVEAGLFPCEPFHADMTEERKEEVLEEFRTSQIQVVVASGSFNMGIDIAGIRLIVHMDEPRNMRDYGQGSGRAGRDGSASRAIIIRGGLGLGDDRVKQYIDRERRQCRRIDIDGYLDGDRTRQRCRADESWCDWCQEQGKVQRPGSHKAVQAAVEAGAIDEEERRIRREVAEQARQRSVPQARRIGHVQRQATWHEELLQRLERWKGICVMCRSRNQTSTHSISRCRQEHSQQAEEERRRMQRWIRYAANVVCYKCGVPKVVCQRWSADGRVPAGEHTDCQYFGVLIGVVVGIKHGYPGVWEEWQRRMVRRGANIEQVEETIKVLGSEAVGQEGGSELVHAFIWLTSRVEEG